MRLSCYGESLTSFPHSMITLIPFLVRRRLPSSKIGALLPGSLSDVMVVLLLHLELEDTISRDFMLMLQLFNTLNRERDRVGSRLLLSS